MTTQKVLSRGKEIIKDYIRKTSRGETARIPVEDEANLAVFRQAHRQLDIQRMLVQKRVSVEFYIPDVVGQFKRRMLSVIDGATSQVQEIVFSYLQVDYALIKQALQSEEVQAALNRRGKTASLRLVNEKGEPCPDIVIATYEDAHNGNLKRFLERFESK